MLPSSPPASDQKQQKPGLGQREDMSQEFYLGSPIRWFGYFMLLSPAHQQGAALEVEQQPGHELACTWNACVAHCATMPTSAALLIQLSATWRSSGRGPLPYMGGPNCGLGSASVVGAIRGVRQHTEADCSSHSAFSNK